MNASKPSQPPAAGEAAHTPKAHYQIINGISSWEVQESYGPNSNWVTIAGCPDFAVAQKVRDALRACNSHAALVEALRDILHDHATCVASGQPGFLTDSQVEKASAALGLTKEGQPV